MSKRQPDPQPHPMAFLIGCVLGFVGAPLALASFLRDPIRFIGSTAVLAVGLVIWAIIKED